MARRSRLGMMLALNPYNQLRRRTDDARTGNDRRLLLSVRTYRQNPSSPGGVNRAYHLARPDVILALITSKLSAATVITDYILQDWNQAGLHQPSAFRAFLETHPASAIQFEIGKLSDRDWLEVQARLRLAIAVA